MRIERAEADSWFGAFRRNIEDRNAREAFLDGCRFAATAGEVDSHFGHSSRRMKAIAISYLNTL